MNWHRACGLLPACLAALVAAANAEPEVTGLELVSSKRVGRTVVEYTYRIEVANDLPGLHSAQAMVTSTSAATTIVDDTVELGDLPVGALTSTDTFTLRHNRRFAFDPDALEWDISAIIRVAIAGQVRDAPIADASVTTSVEGTGLMTFTTTADDSGAFLLSVEGTGLQDFVSIEADGVGEESEVKLVGYVGSMSSILADSTSGGSAAATRGPETGLPTFVYDVTHITTALLVLVDEVSNEPVNTQAELDDARARVEEEKLIRVAATIKTVIDNAHIDLPAGVANTLALARSPDRDEFADFLETAFPDEFALALSETSAEVRGRFAYAPLRVTRHPLASRQDGPPQSF